MGGLAAAFAEADAAWRYRALSRATNWLYRNEDVPAIVWADRAHAAAGAAAEAAYEAAIAAADRDLAAAYESATVAADRDLAAASAAERAAERAE